ncbi:hypothetical protein IFR05_006376, partial [Cadophora sp. M221]
MKLHSYFKIPLPPGFLFSVRMPVTQISNTTRAAPFSTSMGSLQNLLAHLDKAANDITSHFLSDKELSAVTSYQAMLSDLFVLLDNHKTLLKESRQFPRFSKFSELPLELRLMIWRRAGKEGRIIGTTAQRIKAKHVINGTGLRCSLLLVCKESRKEVLKTKINFNATEVSANTTSAGIARIYINLEVDSIWVQDFKPSQLDHQGFGHICQSLDVNSANLQQLAIDFRTLDIHGMIWLFQLNLKELNLVVDHSERTDFSSETTLVPPHQAFDSYFSGLTKLQQCNCPDYYQRGSLRWVDVARLREDRIRSWRASMQEWYIKNKGSSFYDQSYDTLSRTTDFTDKA